MELTVVRLYKVPGNGNRYAPDAEVREGRRIKVATVPRHFARFNYLADFGKEDALLDRLTTAKPDAGILSQKCTFSIELALISMAPSEQPHIWTPLDANRTLTLVSQENNELTILYSIDASAITAVMERKERGMRLGEKIKNFREIAPEKLGACLSIVRRNAAFLSFGAQMPVSKNGEVPKVIFADDASQAVLETKLMLYGKVLTREDRVVLAVAKEGIPDEEVRQRVEEKVKPLIEEAEEAQRQRIAARNEFRKKFWGIE